MQISRDTVDRSIIVVMVVRDGHFFAKFHVFITAAAFATSCRIRLSTYFDRNYARSKSIRYARCVALYLSRCIKKRTVRQAIETYNVYVSLSQNITLRDKPRVTYAPKKLS